MSTDLRLRWNGGRSGWGSGYVDRASTCLTALNYSGARRTNTTDQELELPTGTGIVIVLEGTYLVTIYECKDPRGSCLARPLGVVEHCLLSRNHG